ncbi:MAG: outer membrane beta-barrel protein, partial [Candidatus Acidiferrales bacterium]
AKAEPFVFADFTWLNGNSREKTPPIDTLFFTPEFRADTAYIYDFNHPADDTIGGSSEVFRAQEVQLTQLGIGGDFHYDNVRGRLMTQFGMYSQTTPRNDASPARGQWNLADAYRYLSEAYGGYHWNALRGVNLDAGIFMSYVGLFSYYNFDNWAYQPSYVSSNTPWFFNGVRAQFFVTDKLKIEPWFINGWQSYGRFNNKPGLGGQILWRPTGWFEFVGNQYGLGQDDLGVLGRSRIHTDDSIQVKYFDRPDRTVDKMAFSLTGDLGCEYGGGVSCHGNTRGGPKQSFVGYMVYDRIWLDRDKFGLTFGGGKINNPGRYLVLLPPINGATAASGTPYFTENPGQPFKAWDASGTFDYMPSQYITFRTEFDHRAANVPYFSGPGGITPPEGNTGAPGSVVPGWTPDLKKIENRIDLAIMVKF